MLQSLANDWRNSKRLNIKYRIKSSDVSKKAVEKREIQSLAREERAKNRQLKKNKLYKAPYSAGKALPLELSCEVFSFMDLPSQRQNIGLCRGIRNMNIRYLREKWPKWESEFRRFDHNMNIPGYMYISIELKPIIHLTNRILKKCAQLDANIQWVEQKYRRLTQKNCADSFVTLNCRKKHMHRVALVKRHHREYVQAMKVEWMLQRRDFKIIRPYLISDGYPASFIRYMPKWLDQRRALGLAELAELEPKLALMQKKKWRWDQCSRKMRNRLRQFEIPAGPIYIDID